MECSKTLELMSLYVDGSLNDDELKEVKYHIENCDNCRLEYKLMLNIISECKKIADENLPKSFNASLNERLLKETSEKARNRKFSGLRKYCGLAACALVFIASIGFFTNSGLLSIGSKKGIWNKDTKSQSLSQGAQNNSADVTKNKLLNEPNIEGGSMYTVINVKLAGKSQNEIVELIKSFNGKVINEAVTYRVPEENLNSFLKKVKFEYNDSYTIVSSVDLSSESSSLNEGILVLENRQASLIKGSKAYRSLETEINAKRDELNSLNEKSGKADINIMKN